MARIATGKCALCSGTIVKNVVTKHLAACPARAETISAERPGAKAKHTFHIFACGKDRPEYWVHIGADASATLAQLDEFLRDLWLECCGHLSCFTINGIQFYNDEETVREAGGRLMNARLKSVLKRGITFQHEYDFGTTTELVLKVVDEGRGSLGGASILLLARNDPPALHCSKCGQPAVELCNECIYEKELEGLLCEQCAKEHGCDGAMRLPVVNSPRVGECGYSG